MEIGDVLIIQGIIINTVNEHNRALSVINMKKETALFLKL
jgi:hypothetical protein